MLTRGKQAARDGLGLGHIAVKSTTDFIETGGTRGLRIAIDSSEQLLSFKIQSSVNINNVSDPGAYHLA